MKKAIKLLMLLLVTTLAVTSCSTDEKLSDSVTLSQKSITVIAGQTAYISFTTGNPDKCTVQVDNTSIAQASIQGSSVVITPKRIGNTELTISCGSSSDKCSITVDGSTDILDKVSFSIGKDAAAVWDELYPKLQQYRYSKSEFRSNGESMVSMIEIEYNDGKYNHFDRYSFTEQGLCRFEVRFLSSYISGRAMFDELRTYMQERYQETEYNTGRTGYTATAEVAYAKYRATINKQTVYLAVEYGNRGFGSDEASRPQVRAYMFTRNITSGYFDWSDLR